jgi:oligogalacturonide lyase
MKKAANLLSFAIFFLMVFFSNTVIAQIGKQFPSEKKIVKDPITGTMLTF